jgi:CheY-like chemotaxis protein
MSEVARRVLLVDPDPDQLARTAAHLREHGLKVSLANGTPMACERARGGRFDMVIAAGELASPGAEGMGLLDALAVEMGELPPYLFLVEDAQKDGIRDSVVRGDLDAIVARVLASAQSRSSAEPAVDSAPPSLAGRIGPVGLSDALRALVLERRTGTLSVTTPLGAGEVRLVEGELVDVVYKNLEGLKALARMTREREGTFAFMAGTAVVVRRIHVPAPELMEKCDAERDESKRLMGLLGDLQGKALLAVDGPNADAASDVARNVLSRLRTPATIEELLDDVPSLDSLSLSALVTLDAGGRIKRLAHTSERVPLATSEQLPLVRALVAKGRAPGFEDSTRIVFAGTPGKIAVLMHAVLSLADAVPPPDPPPGLPIPHPMAIVKLGDGVDLELAALPLVPVYAPLWPIALAGAAIVVRMDEAAATPLEDACGAADVQITEAQVLVGNLEESNVAQVANLVRAALDAMG